MKHPSPFRLAAGFAAAAGLALVLSACSGGSGAAGKSAERAEGGTEQPGEEAVSYTHLTLPTILLV